MKMGGGKNTEKIRKIKHMYNISYTGGSSAPFTNHDRSYSVLAKKHSGSLQEELTGSSGALGASWCG